MDETVMNLKWRWTSCASDMVSLKIFACKTSTKVYYSASLPSYIEFEFLLSQRQQGNASCCSDDKTL